MPSATSKRNATSPPRRAAPLRIAYAVGRLDRALRRHLTALTAESGLTVAQYTVLAVLQARGRLSNAALAQRALVSPQAMNEIIQALTRRALIERSTDPAHRRIVHLALTAHGAELLARSDQQVRRLERGLLAGFSRSERIELGRMLRQLTEWLEVREVKGAGTAAALTSGPTRTTLRAARGAPAGG